MCRIIGDEIYSDGVLVAKLVQTPRVSVQSEFVDMLNDIDKEDSYQEKYEKLCDALVGYGDLEEAENILASIKRTPKNKKDLEEVESCLSNIRNALDFMYEAAE